MYNIEYTELDKLLFFIPAIFLAGVILLLWVVVIFRKFVGAAKKFYKAVRVAESATKWLLACAIIAALLGLCAMDTNGFEPNVTTLKEHYAFANSKCEGKEGVRVIKVFAWAAREGNATQLCTVDLSHYTESERRWVSRKVNANIVAKDGKFGIFDEAGNSLADIPTQGEVENEK